MRVFCNTLYMTQISESAGLTKAGKVESVRLMLVSFTNVFEKARMKSIET